jgi:hypothetical protein
MVYHEKTQPAPPCLEIEKAKARGNYNCTGVLERIKVEFKNKCYICEYKEPTTINTEHFVPHKNDKEIKFNWENLFYACGHCNNTKLAQAEFSNILNCTVESDEVDNKIRYHINPYPKEKAEFTAMENTERVNNTILLLDSVYNGTTVLKRIEAGNLRTQLLKEIRRFQDLLFQYDCDDFNDEEKREIKADIVRHLRSSSNFTAFKRWIIRQNDVFRDEFTKFI